MEAVPPVATTGEDGAPRRRYTKKVRGGDHAFSSATSTPITTGTLVDEAMEQRPVNTKRSYKDTIIGQNTTDEDGTQQVLKNNGETLEFSAEMFENRIVIEEKLLGKYECPVFTLSKWEEARIQRPWKKGLIVKLLGRKIGFKALENRLNQLWVSNGVISIIDLGNDFFLVNFTSDKDRDYALGQGPWLVYDHYLTVREWTPNFDPKIANINKVAVWVRFSGLPIEYYDTSFLHFVGNRIGKSVKVDKTTLAIERGKYARLCVEVDLTKPLLAVFEVNGNHYKIEYEGLHLLCLKCGKFGHYKEGCEMVDPEPQTESKEATTGAEISTPSSLWTVVQKYRGNGRKRQGNVATEGRKNQPAIGGSRFSALQEVHVEAQEIHNDQGEPKEEPDGIGMVFGRTKATQVGMASHKGNSGTRTQGNSTGTKGLDHHEVKGHDNSNCNMIEEVVKPTESSTKASTKVQQVETSNTSITRYEDVVEIDKTGQLCINSYEISANQQNPGTQLNDATHLSVNEFGLGHGTRPPDWRDTPTAEATQIMCHEEAKDLNEIMDEEATPSEDQSDSVMEQSTETAAYPV